MYRSAMMRPMYISGDVSYQRSRAVAVSQSAQFYGGGPTALVNQLPALLRR